MTYDEAVKKYGKLEDFEPLRKGDTMQWSSPVGVIGTQLFSFDGGKHVYNVFGDEEVHLTDEEKKIFRKENATMASIFLAE